MAADRGGATGRAPRPVGDGRGRRPAPPIIKSIDFALAFGVAVDAFIVRTTIVPAVMSLLGKAAWWLPPRLDKPFPDVDVEGRQLTDHLAATDQRLKEPELVTDSV